MAGDIQLSTVMLCWNRLSLSQQCLESYLRSISVPYELIVVDNGSTDGTRQWLESIAADPHITRAIHRDDNAPLYLLKIERRLGMGSFR